MPIFGFDASDFDWDRGPMDLVAAARDGIQFFTHKATENTNVKHAHFGEAMRRARDAGIPVLGAYHVVRSPRNARAEVDYFLSYLDRSFPEWRTHPAFFIQVDLEKWPYDAVPAAEGEDFADIAQDLSGKVAVIYASKGQYGNSLAGTSHELWNANYPLNHQAGHFVDLYRRAGGDGGPGWVTYSGKVPKIWQYTSNAVIGHQPTCDANAFRGTLDQLRTLINGRPTAAALAGEDTEDMTLIDIAPGYTHTPDGTDWSKETKFPLPPIGAGSYADKRAWLTLTASGETPVILRAAVGDGKTWRDLGEVRVDPTSPTKVGWALPVAASLDGMSVSVGRVRKADSDARSADAPVRALIEIHAG